MPTVLLEKILELLTNWSAHINEALQNMLDKLTEANSTLDNIADDTDDINSTTTSIDVTTTAISGKIDVTNAKIDLTNQKLDITNQKLDTANGTLVDIKTNTGSVIAPVNNIKNNTDAIKAADETSAAKLTSIENNINTISVNSGKTAAFTEDTATDVHEIAERLQLISSDTTQMRADNQVIIDILNQIYDKL